MNKEELNIFIAEKLMGFNNVKKVIDKRLSDYIVNNDTGEPFIQEYYAEFVAGELTRTLPNYFTEGWEQVKNEVAILGISTKDVTNSIPLHAKQSKYASIMTWEKPNDLLDGAQGNGDIQEDANYKTFKQAQPEIERRLKNE